MLLNIWKLFKSLIVLVLTLVVLIILVGAIIRILGEEEQPIKQETEVYDKVYAKLYSYIEELSKREKFIIYNRYGLGGRKEMTQREIAKLLGISRSYVSRIEKKALYKLKNKFKKVK